MDTWLLWFLWSLTVVLVALITWYLTRYWYKRKLRRLRRDLKAGHKERVSKIINKFLGEED